MSNNLNLNKAKEKKQNEFYTSYEDINKELQYYENHLRGKIIFCNTDSNNSNFVKYFSKNFRRLGLKELINSPIDFRSGESIKFLEKADIVISNPPFSLFREFYLPQLIKYNKKFLVIGSLSAVTYKNIFPLIKENKLWLGITKPSWFEVPMSYNNKICKVVNDRKYTKLGNTVWYTDLHYEKKNEKIILKEKYDPNKHIFYDNYPAINIDRTKEIPCDYFKEMGVPISFLEKYNSNQFEIITFRKGNDGKDLRVKCKDKYTRIIIKRIDFEIVDIKRTPKIGDKNIFNRIIIKRIKNT